MLSHDTLPPDSHPQAMMSAAYVRSCRGRANHGPPVLPNPSQRPPNLLLYRPATKSLMPHGGMLVEPSPTITSFLNGTGPTTHQHTAVPPSRPCRAAVCCMLTATTEMVAVTTKMVAATTKVVASTTKMVAATTKVVASTSKPRLGRWRQLCRLH